MGLFVIALVADAVIPGEFRATQRVYVVVSSSNASKGSCECHSNERVETFLFDRIAFRRCASS